ncbi:MAG: SUMF1/EgtB/PvdO family nonheme iron enzyme [Bacteroidales bacterium]|nr:SUMF1/EgtB/PvdO family nonheme iron enzyme [Bacteroidales bacterium]MDD3892553.1 SUMF1/EgtB/PvdO family nonheme iron enzyme [Bacteroidales bacterium]
MKLVPMGTFTKNSKEVKIDAFWMSDEVTNSEYRAFLESLKENPNDSIRIFNLKKIAEGINPRDAQTYYRYGDILEGTNSNEVLDDDEGFDNYLYSKKYDNYPVVGVSFENATLYCAWKTKEQNKIQKAKGLAYVPEFRIPTEAEWEWAALGGKHESEIIYTPELGKVNSRAKNKYGLHHLNSNVSEWVFNETEDGKRVIKGSSWKKEMTIFERIEKPKSYRDYATGFRVVMTYLGK